MATIAEQLTSLANTKTAIKDAIVAKGVAVADADPFSAYPSKIQQISGGGAPATKFGVSIDNLLGDVDENGVLQLPTAQGALDLSGVKSVGYRVLYYKFANTQISSIIAPDLEILSGGYTCYYAFSGCDFLTNTGLNNVKHISDSYICGFMYAQCALITSMGLDSLETVNGANACNSMFHSCLGIERADFPKLVSVSPANAFGTSSGNAILRACTNVKEIHFRADAQAVIEGLSAYSAKFGATNATIYFDL